MRETIRDALWLWGQEAGCFHRAGNNRWKLPGMSRMTPTEGALYMGIPNLMVVRFNNQPAPPFRQYALPMRGLKRVVWSIIGDSSSKENNRKADIDEVLALRAEFPNLTGAIMDDFFHDNTPEPGRFPPQQVADFQQRLHEGACPLDLYVVVYANNLDLPLRPYLDAVDAITFWTWQSGDLDSLESNFARLENIAHNKRKLLGLYMWDFGACAPIPMSAMKHQCHLGLEWLRAGRIEGMVFLANCIADLDLEAVEYARKWIAEIGDEPLHRPQDAKQRE